MPASKGRKSKVWYEKTSSAAKGNEAGKKPQNLPKKDGSPGIQGAMGAYVATQDIPGAEQRLRYQRTLPPALTHDKFCMFSNAGVALVGEREARRRTIEWLGNKLNVVQKNEEEIKYRIARAK